MIAFLGLSAEETVRFLILGLGTGAAYALAGVGLVQIYRGSGVINFAFGGIAFLGAATFSALINDLDTPWPLAALAGVVVATLVGVLIELLVMRPLAQAAPLVRMIATIGVLITIEQLIPLVLGNIVQRGLQATNYYPKGGFDVFPGDTTVLFFYDRLVLLTIVMLGALGLKIFMGRSRFGLATSAVAEAPLVAEALRVDPGRVSLINWAIGGAIAGLLGVLVMPFWSLTPQPYILVIVPALAAALIGRFTNYGPTIVGGIAIGAISSVISLKQVTWADTVGSWFGWEPSLMGVGWADALPFLVILVLLAFRGSAFPVRGETRGNLPSVGRARLDWRWAIVVAVVGFVLSLFSSLQVADAIITTAAFGIVGLSLIVVIGLAGQISFAQMSMAGLSAMVAARLSSEGGWPFAAVIVAGVGAGAVSGFIFGFPALRTRGPTLAVVTIGLAVTIERVIFPNPRFSGVGGSDRVGTGIPREKPELFGWDLNPVEYPERYAAVTVVLMVAAIWVVSNLRAGPVGRRFLAVRSNERAAAALGISTQRTKMIAFVVSAAIAGLGGVLLGFKFEQVILSKFDFADSLLVVIFGLIGGIGYLIGPIVGSVLAPGGLFQVIFNDFERVEEILHVVGGVVVIAQLIIAPNGIVSDVQRRQAELPELRTALGIREVPWRNFGIGLVGLAVALFVGLIDGIAAVGIIAAIGLGAVLVLVIRRQHRVGMPWIASLTPGAVLFVITLFLGMPRILDPLFPQPDDPTVDGRNWAGWIGFLILILLGLAIWFDERRERDQPARLSLMARVGAAGLGIVFVASTFPLEVSRILFGILLGVFGLVIGIGMVRQVSHEVRLDYEIATDTDGLSERDPQPLIVSGLTVKYGPVTAVDDLNLRIEPGQIVGLIGPNGAGKTTAIDAISGFTPLTTGSLNLGSHDVTRTAVHRRSRLGLARTFQTVEPFDDLTVAENLAAATEDLSVSTWLKSFVHVPKLRLSAATGRVIESFELEEELSHFPNELAQGRRRLLGVARAIANEPSILLLDEPAAGLNATETAELGEQLRLVARDQNIGMLLVEHDMSIVTSICDHVIALDFGSTIFSGPPAEVLANPEIRAAYLGEEAHALDGHTAGAES